MTDWLPASRSLVAGLTTHASARAKQRGIPPTLLDHAHRYGRPVDGAGRDGAVLYRVGRQEIALAIADGVPAADIARGNDLTLVVDPITATIITAYWSRRVRPSFRPSRRSYR